MKLKDEIMLHCGVTPQTKVAKGAPDVDPRVKDATKLPYGHRVHQGGIAKKNLQDKFFVKDGKLASSKVVRRKRLRMKGRRRGHRLT